MPCIRPHQLNTSQRNGWRVSVSILIDSESRLLIENTVADPSVSVRNTFFRVHADLFCFASRLFIRTKNANIVNR